MKQQSKHTPGPWHISPNANYVRKAYPTMGNGPKDYNLCEVIGYDHERVANARLISAAPDLLAALKATLNGFRWHYKHGGARHDDSSRRIIDSAEAAIAKAEEAQP